MKKPSNSSPKHGENREKSVRRTCSNMAKSADYDGEMEFNNETRGKEPNFMIEGKLSIWIEASMLYRYTCQEKETGWDTFDQNIK